MTPQVNAILRATDEAGVRLALVMPHAEGQVLDVITDRDVARPASATGRIMD